MSEGQTTIALRLREQAGWCAKLGSPLYHRLLEEGARDVEAAGPAWDVLEGHDQDPHPSALALRFMGAVHRLVLEGKAPLLAPHYPSAGGTAGYDGAWPAFRNALVEHRERLRVLVCRPVQTNEVGRAAALLGGFLTVAGQTHLPLRLLELGASAGLNLRWDHFYYEAAGAAWGPPGSPVRLTDAFIEGEPPFDIAATVVERRGCDQEPVDPCTPEGQLTLRSYIWPDQTRRHALLAAALTIAGRVPAPVERAGAPAWLAAELRRQAPGAATVVYHSIVMQYLAESDRQRIRDVFRDARQRATHSAPLAWLSQEPAGDHTDVRLTLWPGGVTRVVARAGHHGGSVRWLAQPDSGH